MIENCKDKEIEALSICAVKNAEEDIVVAAVNRDFDRTYVIGLYGDDFDVIKSGEMTLLTGDSARSSCSLTKKCVHEKTKKINSDKIDLPAGSVAIITINL